MGKSGNPARRAQQERVRRALRDSPGGGVRSTFYCDESGNTGVHWGDPDQPIFVHGGWLVPVRSGSSLLNGVTELRGRHRMAAPELKWQHLARRRDSGAVFRDFFSLMMEHACMPFFWVMDKDFITSAKVVETFFDPEYNRNYPMAFTGARDIKKELAEAVSQSADVRQRFADLMRAPERPSADAVRDLATRLADHFEAGNAPALADSLRDFSDEAISSIQDELGAATWMRTTLGHSLPGLVQLLEGFMRRHALELEIVHDNLVRYEPAFDLVRRMFRPSDGTDVTMVGGEPMFHAMPSVTGLRLADSKSEPMIQLADLLCGFVRTVIAKVKRGEELTADERAVSFHLAMTRDEWSSWDGNMPQWMWQEFGRLAFEGVLNGTLDISL
ncbi:DUF3800 domain-containing protein [Nocardioides caldifontis]|uniref:DUF3800 domain-containing protein n=1 Tax=Nocardioides caldifontis TaxID=2588938 RepID=UPI0011DFE91A|nr:DUF3800 domain-containing protein [Nocardioides caldifontis]